MQFRPALCLAICILFHRLIIPFWHGGKHAVSTHVPDLENLLYIMPLQGAKWQAISGKIDILRLHRPQKSAPFHYKKWKPAPKTHDVPSASD